MKKPAPKAKAKKKPAKKAAVLKAKAVKKAAPKTKAKPAAPKAKANLKGMAPGYTRLMPYLTVVDPEKALVFYEKAFGFERQAVMRWPDGKVMHAEARYEDGVFMMGPPTPEGGTKAPAATNGQSTSVMVYVPDVDGLFARATKLGAKVLMPPADMFWGDRMCGLEDPEGHRWSFATHLRDVSEKEMAKALAPMAEEMHAHEHGEGCAHDHEHGGHEHTHSHEGVSHSHPHDHHDEHGHGENGHGHAHEHGGHDHGHAHDEQRPSHS
jgi:PhnB protein